MDRAKSMDGLTHTQKQLLGRNVSVSARGIGLDHYPALNHPGNHSPKAEISIQRLVGGKEIVTIFIAGEPRGW